MLCESEAGTARVRHCPFAPLAGRRWRQPDEGRIYKLYQWHNRQKNRRPEGRPAFLPNVILFRMRRPSTSAAPRSRRGRNRPRLISAATPAAAGGPG
ncbi:hypothetical protein ELI24_18215 [Rhizobium ruizarguesonis]|nr:hypothetical protein ELI24_18215 [Rhizobium ruizarguesonis]TAW17519.1 hypothetical protein ELI25_17660 [Rhizobium ruizarguesonis]TAZ53045.1 hypothetical protein ELH76_18665 [Rhizobium ruizarguesonis]